MAKKMNKVSNADAAAMIQAANQAERELKPVRETRGYVRRGNRYLAHLGIGSGRKIYLGSYPTPEQATAAYKRAKAQRDALRATGGMPND